MEEEINPINKKFQKELASGVSSLVLLSVLNQAQDPMYGYQIAKLIEEKTQDAPLVKQGALYPVLRSLEKNELLTSQVEPSVSGPPRRYYTITDQGRSTLQEWIALWNQTNTFVENTLKGDNHEN